MDARVPRVREEEPITQRTEDTTSASGARRLVLRGLLKGDHVCLPLAGERWVLGRDADCNVRLRHIKVSRKHAEILKRGPVVVVRDLGSMNGTQVNGVSVDQAPLGHGTLLRLGEWLGIAEEHGADDEPLRFGEAAPGIWGGSLLASALRPLVRAASSTVPVVLVGRTGAGKERFARALHALGAEGRVFHAINCATLSPSLADAELFGYRKGAFTGAERSYAGRLRAAEGGTLFLDEVADLPMPVQAKLLRALDSGELAPIGESTETRFEARIVAACQEPLPNLVAAGKLREDLAARLNGVVIRLPELRERRSDVPPLFDLFLSKYSGGTAPPVSTRLYERLCLYDWPGNVRELELLARHLLAVHDLEPLLRSSHLPDAFQKAVVAPPSTSSAVPVDRNRRDVERLAVALEDAKGNVQSAAKLAGISRQRAYRLIGSRRLGELVAASRDEPAKDK
jgi:DNA-binding NtrC family response regulator